VSWDALAAVAVSSAAFAQSTVTISGVMDFANANVTGTQEAFKGRTISTTLGTSATSVLRFVATEDLGGGMRATAHYAFDPRALSNDSGVVTQQGNNITGTATSLLNRDEVFIGLSGGFGTVRLGSPNSLGLVVHLLSSPLGTGVGSGFGTTNTYSQIRYNRSVRYDSPSFNGLTVHALYAPGNDQTKAPDAAANEAPMLIPNARKANELAAVYAAGPLTVGYARINQASQSNGTGFFGGAAPTAPAGDKTTLNTVTANYKMGNTTLYGGWNKGDNLAGLETSGSRVAVRHTIGAVDLMAQYTRQKVELTAGGDTTTVKTTGVRADYNLSKRTAAYFGYERYTSGVDYLSTSAALAASTGKRSITSVGVRHSF
jgi:predicted porin